MKHTFIFRIKVITRSCYRFKVTQSVQQLGDIFNFILRIFITLFNSNVSFNYIDLCFSYAGDFYFINCTGFIVIKEQVNR